VLPKVATCQIFTTKHVEFARVQDRDGSRKGLSLFVTAAAVTRASLAYVDLGQHGWSHDNRSAG
jgi:hypothetical protein